MPSNLAILGVGGVNAVAQTYTEKVQALQSANLIGYWPLADASGLVATDASGNGRDGAYSGVTLGQTGIGDGNTAPSFDGVNDGVNIYTAGLAGAFNKDEFTLAGWLRVSGAGVWTDGTTRRVALLRTDNSNRATIARTTANGQLQFRVDLGGTAETVTLGGQSTTDWLHVAITVSKAADQMKAYVNGAQTGATQTGLGTWAGALTSTTTTLGAGNTSGTEPWSGFLAHWAVWTLPLSLAEISSLATV